MRKRDVRRMRWYVERDKFRRVWRRIAQVLACITVFCTTYALMLPAITLEMEPFCGIENHEHVPACYEPLPDTPEEQNIGLVIHSHSELCFDRAGMQICPLEEIKEHQHTDDCYQIVISQEQEEQPAEEVQLEQEEQPAEEVQLEQEEQPAEEVQSEQEMQIQEKVAETPVVLVHVHTDECYLVQRGALVCGLEESQGHVHEDACFGYGDEPICQPEEIVEHEHTEACYETVLICMQEESEDHLHGDGCYGPGETPICQPEPPAEHEHTEECFEKLLLCGQEEAEGHLHGDACYEMEKIQVCGIETTEELTDEPIETDVAQTETNIQVQQSEETQKTEEIQITPEEQEAAQAEITPEEQETAQAEITPVTESVVEITENRILVCEKQEYVAHGHGEACYETNEAGEKQLVCDLPQIPAHQHSEACLSLSEAMLSCNCVDEAHQHTYECYSTWNFVCEFCADDEGPQTDADLETAQDWEKTFEDVTLTGFWPEDVLAIAKTQLDYQESEKNYEEDETGIRRGYTRYGQWWGDPYGDWNSMFVSFCLHYANVEEFPLQDSCSSWIEELEEIQCYVSADGYIPKPGDLIFLEQGREERFVESEEVTASMIVDRVGIVAELVAPTEEEPAKILVIEGDHEDQAQEVSYELDSPEIIGYCDLPEAPEGTYLCGMENHIHDWMCKDETGALICQKQDHIHEECCTIRKLVYEDDLLWAEMTLTGEEKLPENLHLSVSLITEESDQGAYRAMYSAVGEALFDSTYCVGEAAFCHMELLSDDQPYSLPEGVQADVQVSFHQPLFTPADVANAQQLNTFVLREEVPAEIIPEAEPLMVVDIVSSKAANSYAQSNSLTVEDGHLTAEDVPQDLTEEEPVTTMVYRASEVPADAMENVENGITGLSFSSGQVSSFAVALADTSEEINAWTQVTSLEELNSYGTYMIISANGSYALTGNSGSNATKVTVEPIEGMTGYFTITEADGTDADSAYLQWVFTRNESSGNSFGIKNYASGLQVNMSSSVLSNSAASITLDSGSEASSWTMRQARYYFNDYYLSNSSDSFTRTTSGNNASRNMLIFKAATLSGSSGSVNKPKPNYPAYVEVSDGKTGETSQGDVTGNYYSDPATSQLESLFTGISADDGKVLTDKSVVYGKDDYAAFSTYAPNTFGVTLSALGQEYPTQETVTVTAPLDVVFVLDVSGSMQTKIDGKSRAEAMVDAVNGSIKEIMDQNPKNRVGVTLFSSGAWDLLELGRYTHSSNQYLRTSQITQNGNWKNGRYYVQGNTGLQVEGPDGQIYDVSGVDQANGTYTQAGIAMGAAMFERAENKTYQETVAGKTFTVNRQPIIILLSDGEPTHCNSNYTDVLSAPHYGDGLVAKDSYQGVYGYYTILSANHYKRAIGDAYNNPAVFYTVGMGISPTQDVDLSGSNVDSDVYKRAILNPTQSNIQNMSSTINPENTVDQLKKLMLTNDYVGQNIYVSITNQSYMTSWMGTLRSDVKVVANPYPDDYSYANKAYFGEINSAELKNIFHEILAANNRVFSHSFMLHGDTNVVVSDPVGEDMEVKGAPVLRYGGKNYIHTSTYTEGAITRYVYDYDYISTDGSGFRADLSQIVVEVITEENGLQRVSMSIPNQELPVYSPYVVEVYHDGGSDYVTQFYFESLPVRLIYQVGLTEEAQKEVEELKYSGGNLTYYTNRYDDPTLANGVLQPTEINPYYQGDHAHSVNKLENVTGTKDYSINCLKGMEPIDGTEVLTVRQDLGNNGKLVFEAERQTIDIPVEKKWKESVPEGGTTVDIALYSVVDDTATLVATITLSRENQWQGVFERLPLLEEGGYYALRELVPPEYTASYTGEIVEIPLDGKPTRVVKIQGQNPIVEELVTVTNSRAYVLPATGGVGTHVYTFSGMLLMMTALMYGYDQRRKRERGDGR